MEIKKVAILGAGAVGSYVIEGIFRMQGNDSSWRNRRGRTKAHILRVQAVLLTE